MWKWIYIENDILTTRHSSMWLYWMCVLSNNKKNRKKAKICSDIRPVMGESEKIKDELPLI